MWSEATGETVRYTRLPTPRGLVDGAAFAEFTVDPPGSRVSDVRFKFAIRLQDDSEADEFARYDLVSWALRGGFTYVTRMIERRFLPLFDDGSESR